MSSISLRAFGCIDVPVSIERNKAARGPFKRTLQRRPWLSLSLQEAA